MDGEYLNGKINGEAKIYSTGQSFLIFEGNFINGLENGRGKEYDGVRINFDGDYLNGKRWNGKGKEFDKKGNLTFDGKYINGIKYNIKDN